MIVVFIFPEIFVLLNDLNNFCKFGHDFLWPGVYPFLQIFHVIFFEAALVCSPDRP
jgi:hypothetical protein